MSIWSSEDNEEVCNPQPRKGRLGSVAQRADPVALCIHKFVYDPFNDEIVCERGCGWAVQTYCTRVPVTPNDQSAIVSAGMVGGGLGTDLDSNVEELKGTGNQDSDGHWNIGNKKAKLLRCLKHFLDGSNDSEFWITLTEVLASRGMPPENIALLCALLRKERGRLRRQVMSDLKATVKYSLGIIL